VLDTDTKRRIDTARDILVGKVPDPKSQVEQITIALIYKFMDDMDAESEEFGGKRKFFAGDFSRYGWAKLMRSGLGGHETLNLYAEAIAKMPENPGIPLLFRDIFKNAYLPYRDPETLKMFLKVIDEFTYDHSEKLGDAFEYLLSVLGSQGDAGQFRTPRHIIDFIVAVVDPKKTDVVLDPACGTAGFLISSYKHILKATTDAKGNSTLTPDEKGRLAQNFRGYDISPDMVRLSLVNMYLHGFAAPNIFEYDTLTSLDKWNEYADVILANPPFMSPKGGIKPHNRFSVQSKRSEVLFVDYMAEHLTPGGRAGIIVPEGIIFQSGSAYKQLRELLVNEFLVGVISLPSGVFQPYTGVKTSILVLDRVVARRNPNVMFSDVRHIGVSLGVKRTPSKHNDLPHILLDYIAYYEDRMLSRHSWLASRNDILANECNLSVARYRPVVTNGDQRVVKIGDVCRMTKGQFSSTKTPPGSYPLILTAAEPKTSSEYQFDQPAVCVPLISSTGHGRATLNRIHFGCGKFALADLLVALQPADDAEIDVKFLYYALDARKPEIACLMRGAANVSMKPEDLAQFEIPLPPLEMQKEIVAEIEGYQKIINGARAVVDNYRPHIPIRPDWPMEELGSLSEWITKGTTPTTDGHKFKDSGISYVKIECINEDGEIELRKVAYIDEACHESLKRSQLRENDILFSIAGTRMGITGFVTKMVLPANTNQALAIIRVKEVIHPRFVFHYLRSQAVQDAIEQLKVGAAQFNLSLKQVTEILVPLPPLATQQVIVAEIEAEQAMVAANRELIARFEKKVQAALARVWGEEKPAEM